MVSRMSAERGRRDRQPRCGCLHGHPPSRLEGCSHQPGFHRSLQATRMPRLRFSGRRPPPPGPPGRWGAGKASPAAWEPPRPATEGKAVGARGTIGSGERGPPEWRRWPAGLTDAHAARRDWAPLGPAAAPPWSRRPRRSQSCLTSHPRRPGEEQN
ncbi:uncharacterized protein LOC144329882 [Macaca mulatta]